MTARRKMARLFLGLALGMAFFGCVGLPRRRPPTEGVTRPPDTAQRERKQGAASPTLAIPAEPIPVEHRAEVPEPPPRSTAPPTLPAGIPTSPPASPIEAMRNLYALAEQQHVGLATYIVCLTRREIVRGKKQPEEMMLFKFRKQPKSVYLKWIGPEGKGREAIWVDGQHEGKLHTLLAAGDMPFMPAGKRISLAPDSMLVRGNSRHSITEAGVGTLISRFGKLLDAIEKGDTKQGTLVYLGKQPRPEFAQPLEAIEWTVPPGFEEGLPKGGRRWCYLDGETHLPALIITHDDRGQEVEYYRYTRYMLQAQLDDADFDPKMWDKPK